MKKKKTYNYYNRDKQEKKKAKSTDNKKEQYNSINKFEILNFNLKKIIFSFLNRRDQKTIYWMNKKLRKLLPDSALKINIDNFRKCCSYTFKRITRSLLELNDGTIACFTLKNLKLLKITNDNNLEKIKTLPFQCYYKACPLMFENGEIIFVSEMKELTFLNKDFNLIEKYKESDDIYLLCKISEQSFAVAIRDGKIKIYSKNQITQKYEKYEIFNCHPNRVFSLLYLPKPNYLLSSSEDETINVFSLSEGKSIQTLTDHNHTVYSLISLSDTTFASASHDDEIKFWSIKEDNSIECIRTLEAYKESSHYFYLNNFGSDVMVSRLKSEFSIWDVNTYECIKTYKENSYIESLIVTKDQKIVTATNDNKVNLWKVVV
jgi:WD40 repeat protein